MTNHNYPLVQLFPDNSLAQLTEFAADLRIEADMIDGAVLDPTIETLTGFCEVVEANVGAPIDRTIARRVYQLAYDVQKGRRRQ